MSEELVQKDFSGLKVVSARAIPWELERIVGFGVAVDYEGGKHEAYGVGSMRQAEEEVGRLTGKEPPPFRMTKE